MAVQTTSQQQTITEAAEIYRSRRDRGSNPDGSFDRQGRWYPSATEEQACCAGVRGPSRAYPYSYLTHCRTADHVAHLTGHSATEIRREARRLDNPGGPAPVKKAIAYKAVAVAEGGRLASIYDDATTYEIGRTLRQAAQDGHRGGYYVYETVEAALRATVPESSDNRTLPRVVVECETWGREVRYEPAGSVGCGHCQFGVVETEEPCRNHTPNEEGECPHCYDGLTLVSRTCSVCHGTGELPAEPSPAKISRTYLRPLRVVASVVNP